MKLNILGAEYDFDQTTGEKDVRLGDCDGYCDPYMKRIAVETTLNVEKTDPAESVTLLKQKIKRHEIAHAYLFESGLYDYGEDEKLVDWLAVQVPKMLETFREVEAI